MLCVPLMPARSSNSPHHSCPQSSGPISLLIPGWSYPAAPTWPLAPAASRLVSCHRPQPGVAQSVKCIVGPASVLLTPGRRLPSAGHSQPLLGPQASPFPSPSPTPSLLQLHSLLLLRPRGPNNPSQPLWGPLRTPDPPPAPGVPLHCLTRSQLMWTLTGTLTLHE